MNRIPAASVLLALLLVSLPAVASAQSEHDNKTKIKNALTALQRELRNELGSPFLLMGGCLLVLLAVEFVCHLPTAERTG